MIHPDIERVALLGWHVLPMSARSKAACFKGASAAASCDLDTIAAWSLAFPGCNWRVKCGPSGLFALDVDRPGTHHADGFAALAKLAGKYGPIPPRPMTRTGGSGGAVLFFKHEGQPLRGESGTPAPGLDPHRGSQAIVLPPSRHPVTGGAYAWRTPPWEVSPPPIPRWLATLLLPAPAPAARKFDWVPTSQRATAAVMRAMHNVIDAPSGSANVILNKAAFKLGSWCGAGLLTEADATGALAHAAEQRRMPLREARDTIRSGFSAGLRSPIQARRGTA